MGSPKAREVSAARRFPTAAWQLPPVLGDNEAKGWAGFSGRTGLQSLRHSRRPPADLCAEQNTGPWVPSMGGNIYSNSSNVGRRTLIIHRCPVNSSRGKQTVLQIGSLGFAPLLYLAGNRGRCWRSRFCSNPSTPKLHKCSIYCARLLNMSKFNLIPVMFHNHYNKNQAPEWFSI